MVIGAFVPAPLRENDRSVESFPTRETPLLFNSVIDYLQFDPSIDLQQRAPEWRTGGLDHTRSNVRRNSRFARRLANQ